MKKISKLLIMFALSLLIGGQTLAAATTDEKPKFIIPEFQVPISTVKLSKPTCSSVDGVSVCQIPWLGEYVIGVYKYLLAIAGVIAAVILMAAGLLWIVSGGDSGRVTQAKEMIVGSVTGLILLVGINLILTQINPNLTGFSALKVEKIEPFEAVINGSDSDSNSSLSSSDCLTDTNLTNISNIVALSGVSDPRLTTNAAQGLKKATEIAALQNVRLLVKSANRTYAKQKELWDAELARQNGNVSITSQYVADPSKCQGKCYGHCAGVAVDVCIEGTISCSKIGGQKNAKYNDSDVVKLQAIMKEAGWVRYEAEWWHYQY